MEEDDCMHTTDESLLIRMTRWQRCMLTIYKLCCSRYKREMGVQEQIVYKK